MIEEHRIQEARRRWPSLNWGQEDWEEALTPEMVGRLATKMSTLPADKVVRPRRTKKAPTPPRRRKPLQATPAAAEFGITGIEQRVLVLCAEGLSNKQIGQRLSLSGDTIKKHLQRMYARLNQPNRAALAMAAERAGALDIQL